MFDRYTIKADARERLRSAVPKPYYEGLLYLLVAGILTALSTAMLLRNVTAARIDTYMKYIAAGQLEDGMRYLRTLDPPLTDYLFSNLLNLLCGVIAAGLSIFAMNK